MRYELIEVPFGDETFTMLKATDENGVEWVSPPTQENPHYVAYLVEQETAK